MNTLTIEKNTLDTQPWYKQFWPWFLISLPLSAVIAGITTIFIAMDKPDGLVMDNYYKEGLGINRELAREKYAAELGINCQLKLSGQQLLLVLDGKIPLPETLQVNFIHPTQAENDTSLVLTKNNNNQYLATLPVMVKANWYVKIEPVKGNWRLQGRFNTGQSQQITITASK